jgi:hypothetical protein
MNYDDVKKKGWRGIAAQGSLEEQILRWFDYALHIFIEEDYQRRVITQPTIYNNYRITAKDRHYTFRLLGKGNFPLQFDEETGFSKTQCLQVIYDRHIY